jgi:putative molybdopterin biosynthesis protein
MDSTLLTAEDVARQLRIKKYTVYELIKRGELPSSKVGKQVRISQNDINRYLDSSKTASGAAHKVQAREGSEGGTRFEPELPEALPSSLVISGQDACMNLIVSRLSGRGHTVLHSFIGCYNGLYALYHGRVRMAASHLWDSESDTYNYPYIRRLLPGVSAGCIRLGGRMQGFYVAKGNPLGIRGWEDLARPDVSMINRERGSGTRILLDQKLKLLNINAADIRGYRRESSSHLTCASTVARGGADVSCGCERGSEHISGVDFIPLQLEWYDLVYRRSDEDSPAVRDIISYTTSSDFRQDLEMMGGYDLSQTGSRTEF